MHSRVYNNKRYQISVKGFIFCTQLFIICGVISFAVYNISINRGSPTTWSALIQSSLEHISAIHQTLCNSNKQTETENKTWRKRCMDENKMDENHKRLFEDGVLTRPNVLENLQHFLLPLRTTLAVS